MNEPPGEQLLALFEQVEANWENEAAHRAVLEQCETPEQLRQVARRYREWSQDPDRAERARRQLDAITARALAALTPPPRPAEPGKGWKFAWLLLLLAGVVALALQL